MKEPPLIDPESQARTNAIRLQSLQTTLSEVWNSTHPFSEFSDKREEIIRDERDFPNVFGLKSEEKTNEAIDEPKAPPVGTNGEKYGEIYDIIIMGEIMKSMLYSNYKNKIMLPSIGQIESVNPDDCFDDFVFPRDGVFKGFLDIVQRVFVGNHVLNRGIC